jgi:glycine oxidase
VPDVVIIGAGIIGSAIALELEQRGTNAILLEKAVPGAESSSAAAGMLAPQSEATSADPAFELGLFSLRRYPEWVATIREYSGLEVGYHVDGGVHVATTEAALENLAARTAWQKSHGLRVERLDAAELRNRVPGIRDDALGGLFFPDEGQVDPRLLMRALSLATQRAGVEHITGATVRRILSRGEKAYGVELEDRVIECDRIVLAAGAWSCLIEGSGVPKGCVKPARGQIVALDCGAPPFLPYVFAEHGYLVPRRDGRLLVGATVELEGYEKAVTAGGVLQLLSAACETVPRLRSAKIVEMWSGLRPWTLDQMPILGSGAVEGIFIATGHHRNGILQAPATALVMADLLRGTVPPIDLRPFSVARFSSIRS